MKHRASVTVLSLALIASAAQAGWEIECAGCEPWFEEGYPNHALSVWSDGQRLLANGGDGLYLMRDDGSGWTFETVSTAVAKGVSLAANESGQIWIVCDNRGTGHISLAEFTDNTWTFHQNSVLNSAGEDPHFAYCRTYIGAVYHTYQRGGTWVIETVARTGRGTRHVSMAWDAAGNPVISFLSGTGQEMRVAAKDGLQWRIETIYGARSLDQHSFCMGPDGTTHLAAKEHPSEGLFYGRNPGGGWTFERAPASPGRVTGIAADSAGVPYIAYQEYTGEDRISLARREPTGWIIEDLDYGITTDVGVGVDASGRVTVGYSGNYQLLKVITGYPGQGDWQITSLTTVGSLFDLQVIPTGETFISLNGFDEC